MTAPDDFAEYPAYTGDITPTRIMQGAVILMGCACLVIFAFWVTPRAWGLLAQQYLLICILVAMFLIVAYWMEYWARMLEGLDKNVVIGPEIPEEKSIRQIYNEVMSQPTIPEMPASSHYHLVKFNSARFTTPEIAKWAQRILELNQKFSHAHFTPSDHGLSESRLRTAQYLFISEGLGNFKTPGASKSGFEFNAAGEQFLRDVINSLPAHYYGR